MTSSVGSSHEATTDGGDPIGGLVVRGVPPDTTSGTVRADFAKILVSHDYKVELDVVYPVRCLDEEVTAVLLLYSTAAMRCLLHKKYDRVSVDPLLCKIAPFTVPLSEHLMKVVPLGDIERALVEVQYKFAVKVSADPPTIRGCHIQITEAERALYDVFKHHKEYSSYRNGYQDTLTSITREISGARPTSAAAENVCASSAPLATHGRATLTEQRTLPQTSTDLDTKTRDSSSHQQPANIPRDVNPEPEQRSSRHHKARGELTRTLPTPGNQFLGDEMISTYISRHGNVAVHVYCMDITKLKVDAIVNAANIKMHHGGGVAKAISEAAGPALQRECNEWIKRNGRLAVTKTVQTSGGRLPCNAVIHTVGPRWTDYKDKKDCSSDLFHAIRNCLQTAERSRYRSVALPPISCGIYGVPATTVAQMMYKACKLFCENGQISSIKEIHLVHIGHEYLQFLDQLFGQDLECFDLSVSGGPGGYTHSC